MRKTVTQIAASVDAKGIYTVPDAARLLLERPATVRRWAFGYHRRGIDYAPAIRTEVAPVDGTYVLTFLELVELMFVQALLNSGLSWPKVREASRCAAHLLEGESHPFAKRRWFADAAAVYLRLGEEHDEPLLIELAGYAQVAMEPIIRPYLRQIHFDERGVANRWHPMGFDRPVVVDPRRSFGMPVTERSGVPTATIARLHAAGDSVATIAAWYRMSETEVEAALEFESTIATAA